MVSLAVALGCRPDARILVPHIDDLGVCHGANRAFAELAGQGFVTTGSVMVPCPWFPEIAELARQQPEMDIGVHLTLTSESSACRWRPVSTVAQESGLIDSNGYLWSNVPALRRRATRRAVEVELRAQIDMALQAGLDVTHLDTHMGAAAAPEFAEIYLRLGQDYRLPVLLPRQIESYVSVHDYGPFDVRFYDRLVRAAEAQGVPMIDRFAMGLAMRHHRCDQAYRQMIAHAAPGVTHLSLHCSTAGEVERLHPNDADWRIAEYRLFDRPDFLAWVAAQEVQRLGFREIRDVYRDRLPPPGISA